MTKSTFAILEKDGGRISNFEIEVSILTKNSLECPSSCKYIFAQQELAWGKNFSIDLHFICNL